MSSEAHSSSTPLSSNWRYLPLSVEALTLLKRGVVALPEVKRWQLPWLQSSSDIAPAAVAEQDYQDYLQQSYERLPANVGGVLTFEQFAAQAEAKRADIEAHLRQQRQAEQAQQQGSANDWLLQRFFADALDPLAWHQHEQGFACVWLALDPELWPQAELQPVQYHPQRTLSYPGALLVDPPAFAPLQEQRVLLEREQAPKLIEIQGMTSGLLRLPPKAIRALLLGSHYPQALRQSLLEFWYGDFRYQRIPIYRMHWPGGHTGFSFLPYRRGGR